VCTGDDVTDDVAMTDVQNEAAAGSRDVTMTSWPPLPPVMEMIKAEVSDNDDDKEDAELNEAVAEPTGAAEEDTALLADDDKDAPLICHCYDVGPTSTDAANKSNGDVLDQQLDAAVADAMPLAAGLEPTSELQQDPSADDRKMMTDTMSVINVGRCRVCGDEATGMYFGALVCVPCKVNKSFNISRIGVGG